ncbi:MAG: hypothetical protein PHT84_04810 [Candidatus Pacebacteria bacterium]|nr:hypothetical protein [Candidatus Paceibacterota bacterium]
MNAKEYLSRYHNIKRRIELLQAEVDEYIRLANSIPGINFDQIRVDGTKSLEAPFERWIRKALENELWIADMKIKLPIIKGEIISVIDKIEDEQYRIVMIYRYIEWLSWADIAEKMFYSVATIRRWHDKSLLEIKVSI